MRYWLWLAAKLLVGAACLTAAWLLVVKYTPYAPPVSALEALSYLAWQLSWTLTIGAFFLFACGLACVCLLDQAYRCRVCCRRLRMPVTNGSWSRTLTDRPSTEYICPYGHGKLSVPEARLSGFEFSRWTYYGDFWQEMLGRSPVARGRR